MRIFGFEVVTLMLLAAQTQAEAAHISSIKGDVSVRRANAVRKAADLVNTPLLAGDAIVTGPFSRADVELDSTNTFQAGSHAELRLAQPEPASYQVELIKGAVIYNTLGPSVSSVSVETPSVSVRPSKQGVFRIAVNPAGRSEITAWEGEVEVLAPGGSQWVGAGRKMMARGSRSNPEFKIVGAVPKWRRVVAVLGALDIGAMVSSGNSDSNDSKKSATTSKPTPPRQPSFAAGQSNHTAPSAGSNHPGHTAGSNHTATAAVSSHTAAAASSSSHSASTSSSSSSHSK